MIRDAKQTFKILVSYTELPKEKQKVEVEYLSFKTSKEFGLNDVPGQDRFVRECLDYIANQYFHLNGDNVYWHHADRVGQSKNFNSK